MSENKGNAEEWSESLIHHLTILDRVVVGLVHLGYPKTLIISQVEETYDNYEKGLEKAKEATKEAFEQVV